MSTYQKINSIYKRDERGRFIVGEYSDPVFETLANCQWTWREKIDGTNIRVYWDNGPEIIRFGGRTDNAQIPTALLSFLQDTFTPEFMRKAFPDTPVTLYGEGYGEKIQSGGWYIRGDCSFILFDVRIGDFWLEEPNVSDVAKKLGINRVPIVGEGTIAQAIKFVRAGFPSRVAWDQSRSCEGLVCTPKAQLFDRRGDRIITKIKHKDFARLEVPA